MGRLLDTKFDITAICSLSYMELFQHFNTSQKQVSTFLLPEGVSPTLLQGSPPLSGRSAFLTNNHFD